MEVAHPRLSLDRGPQTERQATCCHPLVSHLALLHAWSASGPCDMGGLTANNVAAG